jgi:hypothetical protein
MVVPMLNVFTDAYLSLSGTILRAARSGLASIHKTEIKGGEMYVQAEEVEARGEIEVLTRQQGFQQSAKYLPASAPDRRRRIVGGLQTLVYSPQLDFVRW